MELITDFNNLLQNFKINAWCVGHKQIDNYFYYDLRLKANAKVKDVEKYSNEISLALKTHSLPTIKVLHNEGVVRLEFVNPRRSALNLFDYFSNQDIPKGQINCLLGQTVDGQKLWMDLAQNPHLIIAGTTGSGKSTLLHNIIANLLNYNNVDINLVDPKGLEFIDYDSKFENVDVIYSYTETLEMLKSAVDLMEFRYERLRAGISADTIKSHVIIIDEFADLIMQDASGELYLTLAKLAQKCRASKIHIILATQRPTVNIIDGTIKANFPARISCRVASHVDSKVVLDTVGAEDLLGKGDALIRDSYRDLDRFQIAYTDSKEVCKHFVI